MPNFSSIRSGVPVPQVAENRHLPLTTGIALTTVLGYALPVVVPFVILFKFHVNLSLSTVALTIRRNVLYFNLIVHLHLQFQYFQLHLLFFSAQCVRYCHDVRPSVCLSICPSGMGVHCDHTVHFSVDLSL